MSSALACGLRVAGLGRRCPTQVKTHRGTAPAREQDNRAGCSPRGGELRAGMTDFSGATTGRQAVSPAVKPEAKSAPWKSQRVRHPPQPQPASPGRDGPGVTGCRAHSRPPREPGTSGGHGCLRGCMLGGLRPGPWGRHWGSPQQLQVSHGHRSCPGRGRQLWPSPHQASASWNVGPAGRGPVSLAFAGSWEPGARRAAGRHSGHRFTTEEWASPRGRQGAGGDAWPWQRRGAYDEGGAEQPGARCESG